MNNKRRLGFTLVELMTTLCVLAVLLGIGAPSLRNLIETSRQQTQINTLIADLSFARANAITSGKMISLCAGQDRCSGSSVWAEQIMIFRDTNMNGRFDADDVLLQVSSMPATQSWAWNNFRNRNYLSFKPDGTTHSLNGSFTLCNDGTAVRKLVISITGRVRLDIPTGDDRCT
ncbi:prepilin-type N-terminal cleavage/methylation domain-containing protein [Stutzerimonas balearica]|uniref:GspH/FimT family pseudopilin n=1 Tax=Pseudomonadaceae TaxID=135621 RepID=UPI000773DCF7|nr:GspH/FimT family pseudopilin [Stutzerimonas balearica]OMG66867.1 prepilin-type N-terminal cleavage/methylation domain-containing protein [Stutzerimonas balearica]